MQLHLPTAPSHRVLRIVVMYIYTLNHSVRIVNALMHCIIITTLLGLAVSGTQDLAVHENLKNIGDAAFLGYKLN